MSRVARLAITGVTALLLMPTAEAGTLQDVKARNQLHCGVSSDTPGFSHEAPDGRWTGLDVDTCRAVAAAVLGDADKVAFSGVPSEERFNLLQSGAVDMLADVATWTLLRDTGLEVNFVGVNYYDGQGFMVRKEFGLARAKELDGATVCVTHGTTTELNLIDFFEINNMELNPVEFERSAAAAAAYELGRCDAVTNDRSALAGKDTFAGPRIQHSDVHGGARVRAGYRNRKGRALGAGIRGDSECCILGDGDCHRQQRHEERQQNNHEFPMPC